MDSLQELLHDSIKDLWSAENQLLKALPRMAKKADSESLREAFVGHLEETKVQVDRLTEIGELMEIKLTGKKCKAMEGLIEEGKEILEAEGEPSVIDAALIGAAQRVEHYEIAAYGTAKAIANHLGLTEVVELLDQTLEEESAADEKLSMISLEEILPAIMEAIGDDTEGEKTEEDDDVEEKAETSSPTRKRTR